MDSLFLILRRIVRSEVFLITCLDNMVQEWLKRIVITPSWENANLEFLKREKLFKLKWMTAVFYDTKEETSVIFRG